MEDGGTTEIAVFGREGVVGLLSALVTREAFGRYIVQMSGTASRIPFERLNEVRNARPALRQLIMRYGEAFLAQTFQTVSCNAVHPVEARCCRWILNMHDRADGDTLPLTHEFLAEMLGVQRSSVSVVTRTLQTAGLIQQSRGSITVTRPRRPRRDGVRMLRQDPASLRAPVTRHIPPVLGPVGDNPDGMDWRGSPGLMSQGKWRR